MKIRTLAFILLYAIAFGGSIFGLAGAMTLSNPESLTLCQVCLIATITLLAYSAIELLKYHPKLNPAL